MPSKSEKQRRFFGLVNACKETGKCASEKIKNTSDSMSKKQIGDFMKVKFSEWLKKENKS
jgi:hypothetical protein